MRFRFLPSLAVSSVFAASLLTAQVVSAAAPVAGDSLDHTPALADLSPALKKAAIAAAMRKVADWQLARNGSSYSRAWTFAALYAGYMAAAKAIPEPRYEESMLAMGNSLDWTTGPRKAHADDQAIAQTYLSLYFDYREPRMVLPTKQQFNLLMTQPDDRTKPVWWWCDALFMAPPVWARLYTATHDRSYLDYMDRQWWTTSKLLYDPQEHLFFRDATFLSKHEANGQKLFWSRGNGWVMAGLARVLEQMPADYPTRSKYVEQFQQMAERVAHLQGRDGLWRPGLLDPGAYPLPEVSGSAFFIYAMAWGINHHRLDRTRYLPVVELGWRGLLQHVYSDGRLGAIQPVGAAPGAYTATTSYVYGVGAFLLAGSEVMDLSKKK